MTQQDEKDHRREIGQRGEDLAVRYLREKGWTILERNWEAKIGELDIIARKEKTLGPKTFDLIAFVEVKSRATSTHIPAELNVTLKKRRKLIKLAKLYLAKKDLTDVSARFDIVTVDLSADPSQLDHYPAAFDAVARFN